jgi:hypothetical protein
VRVVPVDLETLPFAPGYGAPKLVCAQWDEGEGPRVVTRRRGALVHMQRLLEDPTVLLVGHNVSYDSAVLAAEGLIEEVFAAYEAGRIVCTWVFERLGEISGYSERKNLDLATCCKAHGLRPPTKVEGLATSFGQFLDADEIPEPQRTYCIEDLYVGSLYERQRRRFEDVPQRALERLSYRQFVLQLRSVWGMRVDVDAARALEQEAREELEQLRTLAREWGQEREYGKRGLRKFFPIVREDGSLDTKSLQHLVLESYGPAAVPRTATGQVARSELVLQDATDPRLQAFSKYNGYLKTISNDVPNLLAAGGRWVSTRYGLADTTRTTSGGSKKGARDGVIAMQNLRTKGGVRECLRPRPGRCYYNVDASGIELCSFAQVCVDRLGRYDVADMINKGGSPGAVHTAVTAAMLRMPLADVQAALRAKDQLMQQHRTRAKNGVFGYMGGLGAERFVDYVRFLSKGKTRITIDDAFEVRRAVHEALPALPAYLRCVGDSELSDGTFECELSYGIKRRGIWYCAAANNPFQSKAGECLTEVLIDVARECYVGKLSPARPCLFVHDEELIEVDPRDVHEFDIEYTRIATEAARRALPSVITVWEAEATDRYSKAAKRVLDDNGRLAVWSPETGGVGR